MYYPTQKIGQLDCVVVGPYSAEESPKVVVVLCHGFGAPGDDLVPLAEEILGELQLDRQQVTFIFPAAPLILESFGGFEGRAWWLINMQRLSEMMETNDFTELANAVPEGIIEAREMLSETIQEILNVTGLSWDRLILGGFSQGAMLTADTVFNSEQNPSHLVQMSGTMICKSQWEEKIAGHDGLKVLQSHGSFDPVLPYSAAESLRELFEQNRCDVEFIPFQGVHTIPSEVWRRLGQIISDAVTE